jgi:hypothetical protein
MIKCTTALIHISRNSFKNQTYHIPILYEQQNHVTQKPFKHYGQPCLTVITFTKANTRDGIPYQTRHSTHQHKWRKNFFIMDKRLRVRKKLGRGSNGHRRKITSFVLAERSRGFSNGSNPTLKVNMNVIYS